MSVSKTTPAYITHAASLRIFAISFVAIMLAISLLGVTTAYATDASQANAATSLDSTNAANQDHADDDQSAAATAELLQNVDQVVNALEADTAYRAYQHLVQVMAKLESQDLTDPEKDATKSAIVDLADALQNLQGSGVNNTVVAGIQQILAGLNDARNGTIDVNELLKKLHNEIWLIDYDTLTDLVEQTKVNEAIPLNKIEALLNKVSTVTTSPAATAAVAQASQSATVVRQTGKTTIQRATARSAGSNANNNISDATTNSAPDTQVASANSASAAAVKDGVAADLPAAAENSADTFATTNMPLSSTLAHVTTALAAAGTLSVTDYATKRQKSKKQA